jgi:hypothetical protein
MQMELEASMRTSRCRPWVSRGGPHLSERPTDYFVSYGVQQADR